jgi:hypothetical protein
VWRVVGYTIVLAALAVAIFCAIAFTLHRPGVMRFYDRPGKART